MKLMADACTIHLRQGWVLS